MKIQSGGGIPVDSEKKKPPAEGSAGGVAFSIGFLPDLDQSQERDASQRKSLQLPVADPVSLMTR